MKILCLKVIPLIFILLLSMQPSKSHASIFSNFGLEVGLGKNNLYWSAPYNIRTLGGVPVDRTQLMLAYNIRLNYHSEFFESTLLLPFIGYNEIGGVGEEDEYSIETLEIGSFFMWKVNNFAIGIGGKYNVHLNAQYKYSSENTNDRSEWFSDNSTDLGFRISYSIKPIIFGFETWFGLNNLAGNIPTGATISENHFRFILGIVL